MEAIRLLDWGFDALLGLGLLGLAWQALASPRLFRAVVLFVAFGLLLALAWIRLEAPDIALAEVAIGAGLTGALLLAALARLDGLESTRHEGPRSRAPSWQLRYLPVVLLTLTAAGLGYSVLSIPAGSAGLSAEVAASLDVSGVDNPVTAVLLNYRSYDTLLEMLVLLLALLCVWSLGGMPSQRAVAVVRVLDVLVRILIPVLVLLAAYLLWAGADAPGGAFQAGAVLGAAGVLLLLAGWRPERRFMRLPLRIALVAGPALFLAAALFMVAIGRQLLEYPQEHAAVLILLLETGAALSIGVTLAALFFGERPKGDGGQ